MCLFEKMCGFREDAWSHTGRMGSGRGGWVTLGEVVVVVVVFGFGGVRMGGR